MFVELNFEIVSCIWNSGKSVFIMCFIILAKLINNLCMWFYPKLLADEFDIKTMNHLSSCTFTLLVTSNFLRMLLIIENISQAKA